VKKQGSALLPAVIFDLDGVIVDSAEAHFISWQRLARENGREMTRELFHETFGQPNWQILPRLFNRYLCKTEMERYSHRKEELYRDIIRHDVPVFPGVVELIRSLKADGHPLAIGTSAPPENVELVLESLNLTDCFAATVTSSEVTVGKPAPDVFLTAAQKLCLVPCNCVVIEDAIAGVRAAKSAGMVCIAVTNTHPAAALEEADLIVESLRDLTPSEVRRIFAEITG